MIVKPYKEAQIGHITQGFHFNHPAIDFACKLGTFLVAPENCIVNEIISGKTISDSLEDMKRGYGIKLKSVSRDVYHIYWHCLPAFPVKVGDTVLQGKPVAQMGNSGSVKVGGKWLPVDLSRTKAPYLGTHLHWRMMINGIAVDPLLHIDWNIPIKYDLLTVIRMVVKGLSRLINK